MAVAVTDVEGIQGRAPVRQLTLHDHAHPGAGLGPATQVEQTLHTRSGFDVDDPDLSTRPESQQRLLISRFLARVAAPRAACYCNQWG
jgi:hypothetical protein